MSGYGHHVGVSGERMFFVLYTLLVLLDGDCRDSGVKNGMLLNFEGSIT